jgi:prepilin-type N-terminal cleavage/methylation domain-containing protein
MKLATAGFTLIELLISISISAVLLLVGGTFVGQGTLSINIDYNKTLVQTDTETAVNTVARVIKSARSVEAVNSQPDAYAPGAPSNLYSWSGTAGPNGTLILAIPSRDTSGNLLYVDGLHTNLYTDDVIYYFDSTTKKLYKRTIANAVSGNVAKTTCPPASATAACPADSVVVQDIANLATSYFDSNNNSVSIPSGTEAVGYTLTETRVIGNKSYVGTYATTASLRNK